MSGCAFSRHKTDTAFRLPFEKLFVQQPHRVLIGVLIGILITETKHGHLEAEQSTSSNCS